MIIAIPGLCIHTGSVVMTTDAAQELIEEITTMLNEIKDKDDCKALLMCDSGTVQVTLMKEIK